MHPACISRDHLGSSRRALASVYRICTICSSDSSPGYIHCTARRNYVTFSRILTRHGAGDGGGAEDGVVATAGVTFGASTVGTCFRGRFRSSRVTPSSFVMPTTAGSPFLINSYWPGSLLPASRKASRATCSCSAPLISKMTRLTATLAAQWSKEPFPLPIRIYSCVSRALSSTAAQTDGAKHTSLPLT